MKITYCPGCRGSQPSPAGSRCAICGGGGLVWTLTPGERVSLLFLGCLAAVAGVAILMGVLRSVLA